MRIASAALVTLGLALAACTPPAQTTSTETAAPAEQTLPAEALALIQAQLPGFTVTGVEVDQSDGEVEVGGRAADGGEYEIDMRNNNGAWSLIEIQRDIAWADAPEAVRTAAEAAPNTFTPVRVIESRQPVDGSIVYELFAAGAQPGQPTMEVRYLDGQAAVMPPAH